MELSNLQRSYELSMILPALQIRRLCSINPFKALCSLLSRRPVSGFNGGIWNGCFCVFEGKNLIEHEKPRCFMRFHWMQPRSFQFTLLLLVVP